jgi:hypothetical protein
VVRTDKDVSIDTCEHIVALNARARNPNPGPEARDPAPQPPTPNSQPPRPSERKRHVEARVPEKTQASAASLPPVRPPSPAPRKLPPFPHALHSRRNPPPPSQRRRQMRPNAFGTRTGPACLNWNRRGRPALPLPCLRCHSRRLARPAANPCAPHAPGSSAACFMLGGWGFGVWGLGVGGLGGWGVGGLGVGIRIHGREHDSMMRIQRCDNSDAEFRA